MLHLVVELGSQVDLGPDKEEVPGDLLQLETLLLLADPQPDHPGPSHCEPALHDGPNLPVGLL